MKVKSASRFWLGYAQSSDGIEQAVDVNGVRELVVVARPKVVTSNRGRSISDEVARVVGEMR